MRSRGLAGGGGGAALWVGMGWRWGVGEVGGEGAAGGALRADAGGEGEGGGRGFSRFGECTANSRSIAMLLCRVTWYLVMSGWDKKPTPFLRMTRPGVNPSHPDICSKKSRLQSQLPDPSTGFPRLCLAEGRGEGVNKVPGGGLLGNLLGQPLGGGDRGGLVQQVRREPQPPREGRGAGAGE